MAFDLSNSVIWLRKFMWVLLILMYLIEISEESFAIDRIYALGLGDIIKFCCVWSLRKCEKTFRLGF